MRIASPVMKVLLIVFAIIGVFATFAFVGMAFMHGSMMQSFPDMSAACQSMMSARL